MDALAALIFGIVIANALRAKGIEDDKGLAKYMSIAELGQDYYYLLFMSSLDMWGQLVAH